MTPPFFAEFQVPVRRSAERRRKGPGSAAYASRQEAPHGELLPGRKPYPRPGICICPRTPGCIRARTSVSARALRAVSAPGSLRRPARRGRYPRRGLRICPHTPGGICAGASRACPRPPGGVRTGAFAPVRAPRAVSVPVCTLRNTAPVFRLPCPHPGRKTTLLLCGMRCRKTARRRVPFR